MKTYKLVLIWSMIALCAALVPAALFAFIWPVAALPVFVVAWLVTFGSLALCSMGAQ